MSNELYESSVTKISEFGTAKLLADVLIMSQSMLDSAREGDWQNVTRMEEVRRQALGACFKHPTPDKYAERFTEALAAMLHMNEELISLLEVAKSDVAVKRANQVRNNESVLHYLDIASDT